MHFFVHIHNAANVPLVNTALLTDMQINVSCESSANIYLLMQFAVKTHIYAFKHCSFITAN